MASVRGGQVLLGQDGWIEKRAFAFVEVFSLEALAVDLIDLVELEPRLWFVGRKGAHGLGSQRPPVNKEENARGQGRFHQGVDRGDRHTCLARAGGHGDHHALFAPSKPGFNSADSSLLVGTVGVCNGMAPEPGVRRAPVASQSFSQGSGCVETGNLPLCDERRAQIGSVDLVSVGSVYERDTVFAELKGAV